MAGDVNGFICNLWRCAKHQPDAVAEWADYPVSHLDLGARHNWLMQQRDRLGAELQDPDWPGDPKVAGWWLWGQCCWIGSGWCEWGGQIPHAGNAGMGVQALGQIPHAGNAGMGVQALGQIPHASNAGRGVQALGQIPHAGDAGRGAEMMTSAGAAALVWLRKLAVRLERVRLVHGTWNRCLNRHYGGADTAYFFDPPYKAYEDLYGTDSRGVAHAVESWCREHGSDARIALCGHVGDYDLPGWDEVRWTRKRLTYSGGETTDKEAIWFSPTCLPAQAKQRGLFDETGT